MRLTCVWRVFEASRKFILIKWRNNSWKQMLIDDRYTPFPLLLFLNRRLLSHEHRCAAKAAVKTHAATLPRREPRRSTTSRAVEQHRALHWSFRFDTVNEVPPLLPISWSSIVNEHSPACARSRNSSIHAAMFAMTPRVRESANHSSQHTSCQAESDPRRWAATKNDVRLQSIRIIFTAIGSYIAGSMESVLNSSSLRIFLWFALFY